MMRSIRARLQRGQALTELTLLLPVLAGFIALTLEGGLVISDQVNLQHYAYDGGQWAVANRTTATTGSSGTVAKHVQDQICGSGKAIGAADALTRYCRGGNLIIDVTAQQVTAERPILQRFGLLDEAQAASCQAWTLTAPNVTVDQGDTKNLTVTLHTSGSGTAPVVTLGASPLPGNLSNGTPQFNPPTIGTSSVLQIAPSLHTTIQNYTVHVSGIDQCGVVFDLPVNVNVTDGGGPGTVSLPVNLHIDGLFPICIPLGQASTITVNGVNFQAGATVTVGAGPTAVTATANVTSSTQMVLTVPPVTSLGGDDLTIVNPDGKSTTLFNAVTVASSCPSSSPDPNFVTGSSTACAAGSVGQSTAYVIKLTWNEQLIIPWITSSASLTAVQRAFCQ